MNLEFKLNKRHVAKSLSWRLIGTLDTLLFSWLITGSLEIGLNISLITTLTKIIWYYFHEQIWSKSNIKGLLKRHILKTFSLRFIGTRYHFI